jgi:hypothetical protein
MSILNELLQNACPSIRYRIRSEILKEPNTAPEMLQLQEEILSDEWVQKIFSWQQADGWIGRDFHGENSMETAIRVLCEKGLKPSHPVLAQAIRILQKEETRLIHGIGKVGKVLDDRNLGGTRMIQATVLAYAGIENIEIVQDQIKKALQAFYAVGSNHSIEEISIRYRDKLIFKSEVLWPSIYHLRLLAFTQSWRNHEAGVIFKNAIQRLVQLSPIPEIQVRSKSQLIAPASFCMLDFNPDMIWMNDSEWMLWFHRMELLARIGIINHIPELVGQIQELERILESNQGFFAKKLKHYYFQKWGAYSGLMLEKDWRSPRRRMYDLTFRSLMIKHYQNNSQTKVF